MAEVTRTHVIEDLQVGSRVVVRHRLPDGAASDALGDLVAADDTTLRVATRRGEVTGPSAWDGYATTAICEAGIRALKDGGRVEVDLLPRPAFYN